MAMGPLLHMTVLNKRRMKDIEFRMGFINDERINLAMKSDKVSEKYQDALNKQTVKFLDLGLQHNGGQAYINLNLNVLRENKYSIRKVDGSPVILQKEQRYSDVSEVPKELLDKIGITNSNNRSVQPQWGIPSFSIDLLDTPFDPKKLPDKNDVVKDNDDKSDKYFDSTGQELSAEEVLLQVNNYSEEIVYDEDLVKAFEKNPDLLIQGLINGDYILEHLDEEENKIKQISVSSNSSFLVEHDSSGDVVAEAEYDSEIRKIDQKDNELELELQKLNTEHSALETQEEQNKKLIENDINISFKTFG